MGIKILIVGFGKNYVSQILGNLQGNGESYNFLLASGGKKALQITHKEQPEILLLNCTLPQLTGLDFLKLLRKKKTTSDIPVILFIDHSDSEIIKAALEAGVSDFIYIPFNANELEARIETVLKTANQLKQLQDKMHLNEVQLQKLEEVMFFASQTINSFFIIRTNGEILWSNKGFKILYQLTSKKESPPINNIFEIKQDEAFSDALDHCLKNPVPLKYAALVDLPNGDTRWIQTSLTPIVKNRKVNQIVGIEDDITQLKEVEDVLEQRNEHMQTLTEYLENANARLEEQKVEMDIQKAAIDEEKQRYQNLLAEIFPFEIARQLISKGEVKPKSYKTVTVMFTDFKGFSKVSACLPPEELVKILHGYFALFDDIIVRRFVEKIKTIGDAYMCVGGLPLRNKSNPFDVVMAGLEIQQFMNDLNDKKVIENLPVWELRLGIHTGEVVAGVVGKKKFAYDIWGNTVNVASRMETAGHVGMVNISGATYEYIKDFFDCSFRGPIEVKNMGEIDMYFVNRIKPEYSLDGKGLEPSEEFQKFLKSL